MRWAISARRSPVVEFSDGEELRESIMEFPCLRLDGLAKDDGETAQSLRHEVSMNSHCVVDFLGSRAQPQALHGVPCRVLESGDERGCALSMSSDTFAKDRTKEIDVPANEPENIKEKEMDLCP